MKFAHPIAAIKRRLEQSKRNNCIDIRGAVIRSGDIILANPSLTRTRTRRSAKGNPVVAQVIDIEDKRNINESELAGFHARTGGGDDRMVLIRHFEFAKTKEIPRPDTIEYRHTPKSLREVVLTCELQWLPEDAVKGIAFVFHISGIESGNQSCNGMDSAYFIRYMRQHGKLTKLKARDFNPFHQPRGDCFSESYPQSIWNSICNIRQECFKTMSSGGKWDGRNKLAKLTGMSIQFFGWLVGEMEQRCPKKRPLLIDTLKQSRSRKRCYDDLSVTRKQMKSKIHLLRIIESNHWKICQSLLGVGMAVAITKPAPSMKEVRSAKGLVDDTAYLREEDEVRIVCVDESLEDVDEAMALPVLSGETDMEWRDPRQHKRQKLTCAYRGIDFKHASYENGVSELGVQLRFVKVKGSSDAVRQIQHGGVAVDDAENELPLDINDCFQFNNKYYHVKVIRRDGRVLSEEVVSDMAKVKLNLPYSEVSYLVNQYYSNKD